MNDDVNYKILAQKDASFALKLSLDICSYSFTGIAEKDGGSVELSACADLEINLSDFLRAAAATFGLELDIPAVFNIIMKRLEVSYKRGALSFGCKFGGLLKECVFSYETGGGDYLFAFTLMDFNLQEIPFVSEFVGDNAFGITGVSVIFTSKTMEYGDVNIDAGLSLAGNICGVKFTRLMKPYIKEKTLSETVETVQIVRTNMNNAEFAETTETAQVDWVDINKKISVLTLHRAGFSYGGGALGFMFDISLAVKPFTLSVLGAGLSVNLDKMSVEFLVTGFGVEFDNGFITIAGAFNKTGDKYSGALIVGVSTVKVTLVGEYERGHLLAYALVNANFGGPPAFFVTGIAAAFGYNKSIILPKINDVPKFPLVAAANGKPKMPLSELINKLDDCVEDKDGQRFISAGIKFTSFNIAESFVLFNVGFGDKLTFSLLGVTNISVPPMCEKDPIAFAQLALKAVLDPSEGVFSVQAQLTSESYVLDKKCKLTGGFAMFVWFGDNLYSGDFVISLGGYHPSYKKPAHYPDVPRLGLNWQISSHLSIKGEAYFALTPSCIMAGARMEAVYHDGDLKAWFIAQADFMIQWKPFKYSAHVYVSLGASYTVNIWLIHKTFTIELGADIEFWGPEFAGRARITWFIISFTIEFGDINGKPPDVLTYNEFSQSFLPSKNAFENTSAENASAEPLTIAVNGTVIKEKDSVKYVNADGLSFLVTSAVPDSNGDVVIRPMADTPYESEITTEAGFNGGEKKECRRNVPTAMWGGEGELREVVGGYEVFTPETVISTFPVNRFISLDELYELNTQYIPAFRFTSAEAVRYGNSKTIKVFSETADKVDGARKAFLKKMGVDEPLDVSLAVYAANAETLFDEDILIAI